MRSCQSRERGRREAVPCWQADGLSHCLLRSSTSQPITPVSSYQCVVCHSPHSNICTLPLFLLGSRFHRHTLSSLHACLPCWRHVKRQVQSHLTDPLLHVCGCKSSKVTCPSLAPCSPTSQPLSWWLSASVRLLFVSLEAGSPSFGLLGAAGWTPLSLDTWQLFTATRNRAFAGPNC